MANWFEQNAPQQQAATSSAPQANWFAQNAPGAQSEAEQREAMKYGPPAGASSPGSYIPKVEPSAAEQQRNDAASAVLQAGDDLKHVGIGAAKSAVQTVESGGNLIRKGVNAVGGNMDLNDTDRPELQVQGGAEHIGAGIEQVAEFALGDAALKSLSEVERIQKVAKMVTLLDKNKILKDAAVTAMRQGAVGATQGLAHGETAGQAAMTGAIAGVAGGSLEGAAGAVSKIVPSSVPVSGVDIPVLASSVEGKGSTPKAAEWLARKGVVGKWLLDNFLDKQGSEAQRAISNVLTDSEIQGYKDLNVLPYFTKTPDGQLIRGVAKGPDITDSLAALKKGRATVAELGHPAGPADVAGKLDTQIGSLHGDFSRLDEMTNGQFSSLRSDLQNKLQELHSSTSETQIRDLRKTVASRESNLKDSLVTDHNLGPYEKTIIERTIDVMKRKAGMDSMADALRSSYTDMPSHVGPASTAGTLLKTTNQRINGSTFLDALRNSEPHGSNRRCRRQTRAERYLQPCSGAEGLVESREGRRHILRHKDDGQVCRSRHRSPVRPRCYRSRRRRQHRYSRPHPDQAWSCQAVYEGPAVWRQIVPSCRRRSFQAGPREIGPALLPLTLPPKNTSKGHPPMSTNGLGLPEWQPTESQLAEIAALPRINSADPILHDQAQMRRELNLNSVKDYRWENQDQLQRERFGRILSQGEFLYLLQKIRPDAFYNNFSVDGLVGLNIIGDHGEPLYTGTAVQLGEMPEYETLRVDEYGLPGRSKYRGWRTVLLRLIEARIVREDDVKRVFGEASGPEAVPYLKALYAIRNRKA